MKTSWKATIVAAALALSAAGTTAMAGPLSANHLSPANSMMIQVKGGHGHGHGGFHGGRGHGWHGNRGLHRGWHIGRHRGWSHSRHRHFR